MTEPDEQEPKPTQDTDERADGYLTKGAAERAKKRAAERAAEEAATAKKGRRWYHNVIDIALVAAVAYFVKVRFFDKEPEPPPPASKPAASAVASAAPSVMTRSSAEVRVDTSPSAALVETLPPRVMVEVLELSNKGFVKVKTASGKTGWVGASTVVLGP